MHVQAVITKPLLEMAIIMYIGALFLWFSYIPLLNEKQSTATRTKPPRGQRALAFIVVVSYNIMGGAKHPVTPEQYWRSAPRNRRPEP